MKIVGNRIEVWKYSGSWYRPKEWVFSYNRYCRNRCPVVYLGWWGFSILLGSCLEDEDYKPEVVDNCDLGLLTQTNKKEYELSAEARARRDAGLDGAVVPNDVALTMPPVVDCGSFVQCFEKYVSPEIIKK